MQVTSTKSITFPKLGWSISEGETKELPEDKETHAEIFAWPEITPVEGNKTESKTNFKEK